MSQALHRFVIAQLGEMTARGAAVLDYGCGAGEMVALGRDAGYDMIGADVFFDGTRAQYDVAPEAWGRTIFAMTDDRLPFADNSFEAVVANQVFEHVADMDLALAEIARVLKPGGKLLNIFPTFEVIREGHCGVPMAHWLQRFPRAQRTYLHAMRFLGLGYFKASHRTCAKWAAALGDYLQRFTVYRSERAVLTAHRKLFPQIDRAEVALAAWSLNDRGRGKLARLVEARLVRPFTARAVSRLGSTVLVAKAAS